MSVMRYAIISDIHANPTALRAVLADAQAQKVDEIICLGDCVGYGPLPQQALSLVRQYCKITLLGNHDKAVVNPESAANFVDIAGESIERHRAELTTDDLDWLSNLPRVTTFGEAVAAHADFTDAKQFYYVESPEDAKANFDVRREPLLFVGHTHSPAVFLTGQSGQVYALPPTDFVLEEGKRYLVNPGSVGYPREKDGVCQSSYVIYDTDLRSVYFRFLPFDVSGLLQRGVGKKSRRGMLIALGAALLFLLAGLAALCFSSGGTDSAERILAEKAILLLPTDSDVRANLKLAKDSDPVTLEVRFLTSAGRDAAPAQMVVVKKSSMRAFKVPKNAARATFAVSKVDAADSPKIEIFSPTKEKDVASVPALK